MGSRFRPLPVLLLLGVLAPCRGASQQSTQTPTELLAALDSRNWRVRSDAIFQLNLLPDSQLPPSFANKAIALLEREALHPDAEGSAGGEGYGEYLIKLVKSVLRLRDPRATRGIALLGIATSRKAQEFVASQGDAALPYLDEAWQHDDVRHAVAITWGYMLGSYSDKLSHDARPVVLRRILDLRFSDSLAFAWAASIAHLTVTIPALEEIARSNDSDIVRDRAASVARNLRAIRDTLKPASQLEQLTNVMSALCLQSSVPQHEACRTLSDALASAQTQLSKNPRAAAAALREFANRTEADARKGLWNRADEQLLVENARFVLGVLPMSVR